MPDKLGPSTPAQKSSRLASIFSEVESIVAGIEHSPEIVALVPPKYQLYVAVVAASIGTIQNIAHLFTHPDAQQVAASAAEAATSTDDATGATGGVSTPAVSGGNTVPSATVEQTGESTSAPVAAETQPEHESDVTLEAFSAGQAELAAKEPLPSEEEPTEEPAQTKRGK